MHTGKYFNSNSKPSRTNRKPSNRKPSNRKPSTSSRKHHTITIPRPCE